MTTPTSAVPGDRIVPKTVQDFRLRKRDLLERLVGAQPLVCLTAYTAPMARLADQVADLILVGDSLWMVLYGNSNTLGVSLGTMLEHGRAVANAAKRALVVIDLPFRSYQESPAQAYRTAARALAETGATAVKLEGGAVMAPTIAFLTQRGIPVLAHVGLMPQSVNTLGGFRTQGRRAEEAAIIRSDALAVAEAGAFAVVIEGTAEIVAREITAALTIPTIGIGASPACDGQILVTEDLLGMTGQRVPSFVKQYADIYGIAGEALGRFAADVRERRFPQGDQGITGQLYGVVEGGGKPGRGN